MFRVITLYFMTCIVFLFNRQSLIKNKRHNFIFIENPKNPLNDNIYIYIPFINIHILF